MGMMEANADVNGICASLHAAFRYTSVAGLFPDLHPWMMSLLGVLRVPSPTSRIDDFVSEKMALHMNEAAQTDGSKRSATFLSKMLALRNQGKATDRDVRVCIDMNIAAGSDTTAISLSSIVYYLYTNPRVLESLRSELDSKSKAGKLSDMATYQEAQDIPYLLAVIKEALRLHSAVGTQLTRVVPKGGCVIEGHHFPEGVSSLMILKSSVSARHVMIAY
jgi:cytochrome P450